MIILGSIPAGIGFGYGNSHFVLNFFGLFCFAGVVALVIYVLATRSNGNVDIPIGTQEHSNFGQGDFATQSYYAFKQKSDIAFKRIAAGILALLLGTFGIHKFYLGFVGTGLIMLLISVLSCWILSPVVWLIGVIEGIIYLLKTDRDFYRDYEVWRQNWF
jgi:TM2 domain-containing membrane protein YozV